MKWIHLKKKNNSLIKLVVVTGWTGKLNFFYNSYDNNHEVN